MKKNIFSCVFIAFFLLGLFGNPSESAVRDSVFHELCASGTIEEIEAALESGVNINAKEALNGHTPLMTAVIFNNNRPEIIPLLLKYGADINAQSKDGSTALICSVKMHSPNPKVVEELIKNGADVNLTINMRGGGMTALDVAQSWRSAWGAKTADNAEVIKMLRDPQKVKSAAKPEQVISGTAVTLEDADANDADAKKEVRETENIIDKLRDELKVDGEYGNEGQAEIAVIKQDSLQPMITDQNNDLKKTDVFEIDEPTQQEKQVAPSTQQQNVSTESLLAEYVAILKQIEAERAALEEERAQIAEDRWKKALDDRLLDEFVVLVDRSMARLEAEEKRLTAERAWIEREREKLIRAQGTPVRMVTIDDPLIRADLHEKIARYWGN
ncbi:ankyrin repeat domain-containing protein [Synergistaceae bacterium OttesenSCG-928-I11]|nr:ankyrin repeat domain-containing protein [Synergistaceae bacterium OttesenSCG-928-I11]